MIAIAEFLSAGQAADERTGWNPDVSQQGAECVGVLERPGNAVVLASADLGDDPHEWIDQLGGSASLETVGLGLEVDVLLF